VVKTALIVGAAAVVVYAIWRTQRTVVTPGAATGNAVADMTAQAAARTVFGPAETRGLVSRRAPVPGALGTAPQPYRQVLGEVAAREFAPLATTDSPSEARYTQVGLRGLTGTAPDGTPPGITDPVFRRSN
jgi:hypothetical protein